jgi:hypothetical protein
MKITWQVITLAGVAAALVIGLAVLKQLPEGAALVILGALGGMLVPTRYGEKLPESEPTSPETPKAKGRNQ